MAGFLNALGWAAPVIGGASFAQQDYQNAQQKAASEQGFASAINSLGPGYEWAQNWLKQAGPGATPDIAAALGGKIGNVFTQQAMSGKLATIFDDPNKSPQQKLSEAAAIDPEYGKYFGELAVQQAKLGSGFKVGDKLATFLNLQGLTPNDWDAMSKEQKQALLPAFQDFERKSGGSGDTVLKQIYHETGPMAGKTTWDYVPKSGAAGTSAGEVRPAAGATNIQAEIKTTAFGLNRLSKLIDDAGRADDDSAMTWPVAQLKAHGWLGTPDQNDQEILGQVSILNYNLTGIALKGWGARNPQYANEIINYHVPQGGDSPQIIKQKIHDWTVPGGYLDQYRGLTGSSIPGDESGLTAGGDMGAGGEGGEPSDNSGGSSDDDGGGPSDDDYIGGAR